MSKNVGLMDKTQLVETFQAVVPRARVARNLVGVLQNGKLNSVIPMKMTTIMAEFVEYKL